MAEGLWRSLREFDAGKNTRQCVLDDCESVAHDVGDYHHANYTLENFFELFIVSSWFYLIFRKSLTSSSVVSSYNVHINSSSFA